MTISRLIVLQVLLTLGLGTVYFVPRQTAIRDCRVKMELPDLLGGWAGTPAKIYDAERAGLAPDTQFCRKIYQDGFGNQVLVSIVMSGHDLDNSIHRPERCLPAQGWNIVDSKTESIPIPEAPGGALPVTCLNCWHQESPVKGQVFTVYNLNYYWFVGYSDITASHYTREFIDMKDRLVHGFNQHWAYVTVAATVNNGRNKDQTAAMVEDIIKRVFPKIILNSPTPQGA